VVLVQRWTHRCSKALISIEIVAIVVPAVVAAVVAVAVVVAVVVAIQDVAI
jgi:hypothetical protein